MLGGYDYVSSPDVEQSQAFLENFINVNIPSLLVHITALN